MVVANCDVVHAPDNDGQVALRFLAVLERGVGGGLVEIAALGTEGKRDAATR